MKINLNKESLEHITMRRSIAKKVTFLELLKYSALITELSKL